MLVGCLSEWILNFFESIKRSDQNNLNPEFEPSVESEILNVLLKTDKP